MPATAQLLLPGAAGSSARLVGGAGEAQLRGERLREHASRVGAGGLHARRVGGIVRRVPVGMAGIGERDELVRRSGVAARGRGALQAPPRDLVAQRAVLQLPPHRVHHQHRVFRQPFARLRAQQQVFPGTRAQRGEPGVHAARVRLDDSALLRRARLDHAARHRAKAETPRAPVLFERHRAEQLGQLAGRETARQVHLEEAVLGVRITQRVGEIGARGGGDHRDAARIALDGGFAAERRRVRRAFDLRQALAHGPPGDARWRGRRRPRCPPRSIAASAAIS